jgi:hypothetical protein
MSASNIFPISKQFKDSSVPNDTVPRSEFELLYEKVQAMGRGHEGEVEDLKNELRDQAKEIERLKEQRSAIGTTIETLKKTTVMAQGELVDKCLRRWRMLGMVGGLFSPGTALVGYLGEDKR